MGGEVGRWKRRKVGRVGAGANEEDSLRKKRWCGVKAVWALEEEECGPCHGRAKRDG
jgi:hypothetical protein